MSCRDPRPTAQTLTASQNGTASPLPSAQAITLVYPNGSVRLTASSANWSGGTTLQFESTPYWGTSGNMNDVGVNWTALTMNVPGSNNTANNTTGNGTWAKNVPGIAAVRARVSAYGNNANPITVVFSVSENTDSAG